VTVTQTVLETRPDGLPVPRILLEGTGPASTLVDLYLFSVNPVVVTLETDANGVWQYALDQPVSEGEHRALTVVKLAGRSPIRSAPLPFAVARAAGTAEREGGLIVAETTPTAARQYLSTSFLVIIIAVIIVLGGAFLVVRKSPPSTA
jgi:hypothetical protein